ncbi:MAG: hypothetical protein ACLFU5_04925 [Thermoplasmata archaeon]
MSKKTREFGYWKDRDDNSQDAEIVMPGGSIPRDKPDMRERIFNMIVKNARGYELSREDYLNEEFVNRDTLKCVRKVAEKDDDLIINGSTKGGVPGLDDVPYQTLSPQSGTWDDHSDSGATPYADVVKMVETLRDQSDDAFGLNPGALVLAMDGKTEAQTHLAHKAESEKDTETLNRLAGYVGRIDVIPTIPTGSAYLMEVGPEIAEYIIAEDITVEQADYIKENQSYIGNVYCRTLPLFYQHGPDDEKTTAIVEMEGLV